MDSHPLLFTAEFRRKMARLSQGDRLEWLASLAGRYRYAPSGGLAQEIREVARGCRLSLVDSIDRHLGPFEPSYLHAMLEVPRERFVRPQDLGRSADDTPLALDDRGLATISAPHAYLLSFRRLELAPGDALVELGTGSGYGAALAAFIIGPTGRVTTFEIDEALVLWAEGVLSELSERHREAAPISVHHGDAMASVQRWDAANKVVVTFAIDALPAAWLDALPEGGRLIAPVGARDDAQRLVLARREGGRILETEHEAVRYVRNRSSST